MIVLGQSRGEDLSDSQEGNERTRANEDKKQEGKFQMRFNGKKNQLDSLLVLAAGPRGFQNSSGESTDQRILADMFSLLRADK